MGEIRNQTALADLYDRDGCSVAESGIMAWLFTPGPLLPLSPRAPATNNSFVASAPGDILKGDATCNY